MRPWQPFQSTATIRLQRPPREPAGEPPCASRSSTASFETTSHGPPVWRPSSNASSRVPRCSWSPPQGGGSRWRRTGAPSSPKRPRAGTPKRERSWSESGKSEG